MELPKFIVKLKNNAKAAAKQVASLRATATRCAGVSLHLRYLRFLSIGLEPWEHTVIQFRSKAHIAKYRGEGVYDKKEKLYTHMAVQKKTNSGDKPEEKKINWMQVGVIGFCILMVVMCVLSFANFQNFFGGNGSAGPVEEGNPVAVQYTMYVADKAVFTSVGGFVAGTEVHKDMYVPVENSTKPYLVFAAEQNAISTEVIGMEIGEKKSVTLDGSAQKYTYSKEDVEKMGLEFAKLEKGGMLQLDFPYIDELGEVAKAVRTGVITEINDKELTLQYGTDKIEMTFGGYLQIS